VAAHHGILEAGLLTAQEISLVTSPALAATNDRWALGWARNRFTYDGLPMNGPVHGFDEPLDLPLAWRAEWGEKWTATGTEVNVGAPIPAEGEPLSQISLTTGSLSRRTAEFALFRNVGPVDVALDFEDREQQGVTLTTENDSDRFWFRIGQVRGKRPDWAIDLSTAFAKRGLWPSGELGRDTRRLQGFLRGPLGGGETRVAFQLRREALQLNGTPEAFGEVRFDGYTVQGDWAAPGLEGFSTFVRWDHERRRGVLSEDRTFNGIRGGARWGQKTEIPAETGDKTLELSWGLDGTVGNQEPYGFTWTLTALFQADLDPWRARVSIGHDEGLPPMILGVDRAAPEEGMADHLEAYETATDPERQTIARVEAGWQGGPFTIDLGGWGGRQWGYRLDANPLWTEWSVWSPLVEIPPSRRILGGYGDLRIDFSKWLFATGHARIHDRPLSEVPYLTRWLTAGALHFRQLWFRGSLDFELALGGFLLGPRENPLQFEYPSTGIGYLMFLGRIDNGIFFLGFQNLSGTYVESALRYDLLTPAPIAGQTFTMGLTMYLTH
jgi:hypothetical protein